MTPNGAPSAPSVQPSERLIALVGAYGSGKTEVAVNLALHLRQHDLAVQIADLDIVNPYFRCREAHELMRAHGVRVVIPPGSQAYADLPIVVPEIAGMLRPPPGTVSVLDVGGDDVGARVLSSFRPLVRDGSYELWQVINGRRPFSDTVDACLAMQRAIHASSRLRVTGVVANTHLIDETTEDVVLDGVALARAVADAADVPLRMVAVMEELADCPGIAALADPVLRLRRRMLPPWRQPPWRERGRRVERIPAPRPVPIGKPTPQRFGCGATGGSCHG